MSPMFGAFVLAASFQAAQAPPRYTIETAAESRPGCSLLALHEDGVLRIEQAGALLALPRFVSMRQTGAVLPGYPHANFLLLTNGDRVPLDAEAAAHLQDNRVRIWPAGSLTGGMAKPLSVYAPNIVMLFWALPDGVDDADLFFAKLQEEPRKRDVIYLRNGDRIEGTLTALSSQQGCVVSADRKEVQTPWSKLAGITWNTDRQARLRTKKAYFSAVLEGGARLNFLHLRFDEKARRWTGKTQFGADLDLPERSVLALDVRQGHAVDLAELTPSRFEQRPYLGISWPLAKNAAVTAHPLRLSDGVYEKGLGMHAPCRVSYKLDGQYQRLVGLVGLDERIARRGQVRVAVELDGKRVELNGAKELTSRDPPAPVQLDLRGVRELTLVVDLGFFGDVQAHVNWANVRLIKKE